MHNNKLNISRRQLLVSGGQCLLASPFLGLAGCGGGTGSTTTESAASSSSTITTTTTTTTEASSGWASGGTDLITVDYPADSIFADSGSCSVSLTESTTEGPCYLGVNEREDIAEGETGLPMQLCLQLVDEDCNPLSGYLIEVWHCNSDGLYSGDTSDSDVDDTSTWAGSFCTDNDSKALASTWFRGEQTTDSSGRVNFKTCFPGWYSGRTIHIHFRVRNGGGDYVVSQFCFSDSFCETICTTHELYSDRGEQDTPLSGGRDTVFPSSGYEDFMLNTEQNSDGTLLGYRRIVISA